MDQQMVADCNRVTFLNIRFILIMQKLYTCNLFFEEKSVISIYKDNFSIYLLIVILSDFDNIKLGKILDFFYQVTMDVL